MSESNQSQVTQPNTRFSRKSGRTLVLKLKDTSFDTQQLENFTGVQNHTTTQNNAVFVTFDTKENALNALKSLKSNNKEAVNVKFAHYKVFFKLEGLTDDSKYDEVKTQHTNWVESNTGGEILYYKLYRKNDTYLNCGDLTVDTKEAIDQLLSTDKHKNFKLDDTYSGTYYHYNRLSKNSETLETVVDQSI
tara:strand:+ start:312 stop:884 length:573 start_codon:yes stop_codon:yes gene_type:complete